MNYLFDAPAGNGAYQQVNRASARDNHKQASIQALPLVVSGLATTRYVAPDPIPDLKFRVPNRAEVFVLVSIGCDSAMDAYRGVSLLKMHMYSVNEIARSIVLVGRWRAVNDIHRHVKLAAVRQKIWCVLSDVMYGRIICGRHQCELVQPVAIRTAEAFRHQTVQRFMPAFNIWI